MKTDNHDVLRKRYCANTPKMKRKMINDTANEGSNEQQNTAILDVSECDLSSAASSNNSTYFSNFFHQHCNTNNNIDLPNIETLSISKCRLGPHGIANLFAYLSTPVSSSSSATKQMTLPMPNLKHIILQRNAIGSAGGRAIGTFLSINTNQLNIETLDISLNDIKSGGGIPTAAEVISNALITNSTLTTLILEKCALGPEGATLLSQALVTNTTLTNLQLAGNMISPIGAEHLFNSLASNSTLQTLGLKMNRIGGCQDQLDIKALSIALLGGVCQLQSIDLSYNDVKCTGCVVLCEALIKTTTLQTLNLEKNDISFTGAMALGNALNVNESIETLVLKGNDLYCHGGSSIGGALKPNITLKTLDLSSCSIENGGGGVIGRGLAASDTLEHLYLDKNRLGEDANFEGILDPTAFFSIGVSNCESLKTLSLSGCQIASNGHAEKWGEAISTAISNCTTLEHVNLSNNSLTSSSIVDSVSNHSSIRHFDISDNNIESISIETQLVLAKRIDSLVIDMSLNPLSSPPLGRMADHENLKSYLELLASEKSSVNRVRLMVLGYGGVGKSTFCRAMTMDHSTEDFQSTLSPVQEWGVNRISDWAARLGTSWSDDAVRLVISEGITGKDLPKLIKDTISDNVQPSELLVSVCTTEYPTIDVNSFARAVSALMAKGYLSTVGVVKVDGNIQIGDKTCSLVDFAGQVEFLVSHQLLLSSMHTINMIIQPSTSFDQPTHRHYGSWNYWTRFLKSLGDRRDGSLLLVVSQIDKLEGGINIQSTEKLLSEFVSIKGVTTTEGPLLLDYSPSRMASTIEDVKRELSASLDKLGSGWWVPSSYEALADILRNVAKKKSSSHQLPILTKAELIYEIDAHCNTLSDSTLLLTKMKTDEQLLQRAIKYLEAVGDAMEAGDELLLDPVGWFSSFLSHFIKDDLAVSSIQIDDSTLRNQRGIVSLKDIIHALKHEYKSPEEHISQIMQLLCGLELCVQVKESVSESVSYMFPCLLPPLASDLELAGHLSMGDVAEPVIRCHRFREFSDFIPPGLFVGVLARLYQKLAVGVMHPSRMYKDAAVLFINKSTRVLLRCDIDRATFDVIAIAPDKEQLFVGVAKGQANVVTWIVHFIKMFLRSYNQLSFVETWLCPSLECNRVVDGKVECIGSEFILELAETQKHDDHDCDIEGCYRFLGKGHSIGRMKVRREECSRICNTCQKKPIYKLREDIS